jgi:hypothetical protein
MKSQQFISYLLGSNSTFRGDCPNCNGKYSFSISRVDGWIVYHCFRASCGLRGKIEDELSIDVLRNILSRNDRVNDTDRSLAEEARCRQQTYSVPSYFISPLQNTLCYSLLKRYNLLDFYSKNTDLIRYDPKLDRCVFILKDHNGVTKGAVGRSLSYSNTPRWRVYERIDSCPFSPMGILPEETPCILVEDCISACVLVPFIPSLALLGTSIPDELIAYLSPYSRLYIALDDDATRKSIVIQKKLSAYKPTSIISLRKDLKYYSKQELENLIKEL